MTDLAVMLAASGAAGIQARRVIKMRRMPKLRLRVDMGAMPQRVRFGNVPVLVYMLKLINTGLEAARGCEAMLERVEFFDGALWHRHPGFPFSLQLPWSGVGSTARLNVAAGEMSCELPSSCSTVSVCVVSAASVDSAVTASDAAGWSIRYERTRIASYSIIDTTAAVLSGSPRRFAVPG